MTATIVGGRRAVSSSAVLDLFVDLQSFIPGRPSENVIWDGAMSIIPLLAQSAFEPETIERLVLVFEDAWQKVEQSGSKLASPAYKRAAQEIIAKRIIETAQRGEFDPRQLADDAVNYLEQSYA
ncbi:MAG TPA: hypothetical protein VHU22_03590 [Xanthobacteraceae bacterium]|nr:hypothetical protein [Xanthobacteraceae bacterium]